MMLKITKNTTKLDKIQQLVNWSKSIPIGIGLFDQILTPLVRLAF